ncbi:hypothetical protein M426DRAFT_27915 [Hypoxylon sp. CI-4A]|nr:hypothetical protein M426DRAFT_27915 [Hypoxylon sp. CI-4A]
MSTVSNSDAKSYDTTFSRNLPLAYHSPNHTTPSQSRSSSPTPCQMGDFDPNILRGIGQVYREDSSILADDENATHLMKNEQHSSYNNNMVNFNTSIRAQPPTSITPTGPQYKMNDTIINHGNNPAESPGKPWPIGRHSNMTLADRLLTDPPGPVTFEEWSISSEDSLADQDLDLEKSADQALSEWFGISLHRLVRPNRVLDAFEQVKKQCVSILQDEGQDIAFSESEQECEDVQDVNMVPCDAGESSRSTHVGGLVADPSNNYSHANAKQFNEKLSQTGSSPEGFVKVRGKNKKHRVEGELSCPYRKRNPIRFNVRDYERCANTSYPSMTQLK